MQKNIEKPTLLLLSKRLDIRRWIRTLAQEEFYLLEETLPYSALQTSKTTQITYILVDGSLEEDILSFCHKLKEESHLEQTPILLLSGKLNKSFREETAKAGINGLIPPFAEKKEFLEKLSFAKKTLETKNKSASLSAVVKQPLPQATAPSLKKRVVLSAHILDEMKKIASEKIFSLVLVAEVDFIYEYSPQALEEIALICQEEWKKIFPKEESLFSFQQGKFLALFPEIFSKAIEEKIKEFQKRIEKRSLSSSQKKNSFSLSFFFGNLKEKRQLKKEEKTSFFNHILSKADEKLEQFHEKGQFFSIDIQG